MPEARRFGNVDLLRAIAALAVLGFHVVNLDPTSRPGSLAFLRVGWIGVDHFFVVSGFVIGWSAMTRYAASPQQFARDYWRHRLWRIAPLYALVLAAWVALFDPPAVQTARQLIWQFGTHLTFTHSFFPSTFGSIDGPTWSLAIEMQFYLAVALAVPWLLRAPPWRIVACGVVIAWAWRASSVVLFGPDPDSQFRHSVQLPGTLDQFAIGIALAKWTMGRASARYEAATWMAAAAVMGSISLGLLLFHADDYWQIPALVVFWRTLVAIFFASLVAAAIALPESLARGPLRPLAYLGEISYGIYLWHLFAVMPLAGKATVAEVFLAAGAITIALAAASWHLLEKPLLNRARRTAARVGAGTAIEGAGGHP